ncbi:hypothetical protein [Streptomyces rhizoryzae]|uniref:hypothetical protein n=1 Tax=Streptomyces rhizoryzae TaxID=2932493 RepID=UPI0027E3F80C|nr:hypothetical protein [Streptomyces rhizoryzae]
MRAAWLRAAAPVAVLALTLTACGGTNGAAGTAGPAGAAARPNAAAAAPAADTGPAAPSRGGALGPGRSGTGRYREDAGKVTYEVAAQKVRVGTEAEAQKMVQDPKDANGLVPATAYVKFTNRGPSVVTGLPRVANGTEIYADGQRGGLLLGSPANLPGCEDPLDIDDWAVGRSHVICQTYMIPRGARSLEVRWGDDDAADPLIWRFGPTG